MSKKLKWTLAGLLVFSVVFIAQASALNSLYMPLVYNNLLIATATPTPKPGDCISQSFPVKTIKVCFTDIDPKPTTGGPINEWVTIKNTGSSAEDLEGWRMISDSSTDFKFTFPQYILNAGKTVKVWTKSGTNSSTELFMNREVPFWGDNKDCGYLREESNILVNSFCYGLTGFYTPTE